jgi:3-hydroxyisobutyrate dehydrogenase
MGTAVCERLVEAGSAVLATDADPARAAPAQARAPGVTWLSDGGQVAAGADVLITVLPGTAELLAAMTEAAPALRPGAAWIDMTSSAPEATAELVARLGARDVDCLEAPMGGDPAAARAGELQRFVGGPARVLERRRDLLEALGRVEHVGGHGAGYTTKLLVNLLWFGQAIAVGEALLVARSASLDVERLQGVLGRSSAASRFVQADLPRLLEGDYLTTFGLDRCCEELDAVAAIADEHGVPWALSSVVRGVYREALERYGAVDGELLAVALLEEQAGLRLRRSPPDRAPPRRR